MIAKQRALSPDPIRLLLVDANQEDHALLTDLLDAVKDVRFAVDWAMDLATGRDRMENGQFDACLIDQTLPDGDGLKLLETASVRAFVPPMILLAERGCPDLDRRAMALGASNFLDKTRLNPTLLERTIRYAIKQRSLMEDLARKELRDDETGLIGTTLFRDRLKHALAFATRRQSQVAVMFIAIDRVDESLAIQASRLTRQLRDTDTIARLATGHLALILEGLHGADDAALVARKVLDMLAEPIPCHDGQISPHPSIGIALFPEDCGGVDALLRQADGAMRQAFAEGGHQYRFGCDRRNGGMLPEILLGGDIKQALEEQTLTLRYRPLVHVAETALSLVVEVYTKGPESRLVLPRHFFSIAHDRLLIARTMNWMLMTAVSQLLKWRREGILKIGLSLPFMSARPYDIPILEQAIRQQLDQADIAPDRIEIDLDQDLVAGDIASGGHRLAGLRKTGVRLALDDFGRAETSFQHLTSDLIQSLKMSPELYQDLPGNRSQETLLKAIVNLGHDLDLRVVANGVRDDRQFAFLRKIGCDAIKLQVAGSSLTADTVSSWLRQQHGHPSSAKPQTLAKAPSAANRKPAAPAMMASGAKAPLFSLDTY